MSLYEEWKKFTAAPKANPPLTGDELTQFLEKLSRDGKLRAYTEVEWAKITREYNLTPGELGQFMEQVASYLPMGSVNPKDEKPFNW